MKVCTYVFLSGLILLIVSLLTLAAGFIKNLPLSPPPSSTEIKKAQFEQFKTKKLDAIQSKKSEVSIFFVGDVMLTRTVASTMQTKGTDYCFSDVSDQIKNADIAFANLENPITEGRKILPLEMIFRADPGAEMVLANSGFDIVSLANNHMVDFGYKGVLDTLAALDKSGIKYVGAGKSADKSGAPVFIESKGLTFAFLAFNDKDVVPEYYFATDNNPGTAKMDTEISSVTINKAKSKADFVIVSMHSGDEYAHKPNLSQQEFARGAIDAGADLVVGHHPHVVQPMEKYKDKYIFYSLGNFVFDQIIEETRQGMAIQVNFDKSGVVELNLIPAKIENWCKPRFIYNTEALTIIDRLAYDYIKDPIITVGPNYLTSLNKTEVLRNSTDNPFNDLNEQLIGNLDYGKLSLYKNDELFWESPNDWWVNDFSFFDSTKSDKNTLNISVWRSGRFGSSRPFWEPDDYSVKNHFFILEVKDDDLYPIWQSSSLEAPNCFFNFQQGSTHDSNATLFTLEGSYSDNFLCKPKKIGLWSWTGWGFARD